MTTLLCRNIEIEPRQWPQPFYLHEGENHELDKKAYSKRALSARDKLCVGSQERPSIRIALALATISLEDPCVLTVL